MGRKNLSAFFLILFLVIFFLFDSLAILKAPPSSADVYLAISVQRPQVSNLNTTYRIPLKDNQSLLEIFATVNNTNYTDILQNLLELRCFTSGFVADVNTTAFTPIVAYNYSVSACYYGTCNSYANSTCNGSTVHYFLNTTGNAGFGYLEVLWEKNTTDINFDGTTLNQNVTNTSFQRHNLDLDGLFTENWDTEGGAQTGTSNRLKIGTQEGGNISFEYSVALQRPETSGLKNEYKLVDRKNNTLILRATRDFTGGGLANALQLLCRSDGYTPAPPPSGSTPPGCTDSDSGGNVYFTLGTCTDSVSTFTDFCDGATVRDYYCGGTWNGTTWSNVSCQTGGYFCPNSCSNGACITSNPEVQIGVIDFAFANCTASPQSCYFQSTGFCGTSPVEYAINGTNGTIEALWHSPDVSPDITAGNDVITDTQNTVNASLLTIDAYVNGSKENYASETASSGSGLAFRVRRDLQNFGVGGENCTNSIDDDSDSKIDCRDTDCNYRTGPAGQVCESFFEITCNDGKDNDGDFFSDSADPDCIGGGGGGAGSLTTGTYNLTGLNTSSQTFDFSNGSTRSHSIGDITFNKSAQGRISLEGSSGGITTSIFAQLFGNPALGDIFSAPPLSDPFVSYTGGPANTSAGRAYVLRTKEGNYGKFKVNALYSGNDTIEIAWAYQSSGSQFFGDANPGGQCGLHVNLSKSITEQQGQCLNASQSGAPCVWDFVLQACKEDPFFSGGDFGNFHGGHVPNCFELDNNYPACLAVNVCNTTNQTIFEPGFNFTEILCDPTAAFNNSIGIKCGNVTTQAVCNNIPFLSPLCTWNGTTCKENTTKTHANLPSPTISSCELAASNQTLCNDLIQTYYRPCIYKNNRCEFSSGSLFEAGGGFDIITSESSCTAIGGKWVTNAYIDSSGILRTDSFCEPQFGSIGNCNTNCAMCEKGVTSVTNASQTCGNSSLGFCTFQQNANSPNSFGFCFPGGPPTGGGGGGFFPIFGKCADSCFNCFTNTTCSASAANCTWTQDQFSFDIDQDGSFNASEDGFCEKKQMAAFKDCNQKCEGCFTTAACIGSTATDGCFWVANSTAAADMGLSGDFANFFIGCLGGSPSSKKEVCFMPGDEEADGTADCLDTDCAQHPFCGFGLEGLFNSSGFSGPGAFNVTKAGFGADCPRFDNTNSTICETYNFTAAFNNTCYYHPAPPGITGFWCDPAFEKHILGDMNMFASFTLLGTDNQSDAKNTSQQWLEITEIGVREEKKSIAFDIGVKNITNSSACYKAYQTSRNDTAKYYRYLDIDNNQSTGCNITNQTGSTLQGFDYKAIFIRKQDQNQSNVLLRCTNASTFAIVGDAQLTFSDEVCGISSPITHGANSVIFQKEKIGDPKGLLRLFFATANSTGDDNGLNQTDSAGPLYYSIGTADFKFEDCSSPDQDLDGDGFVSGEDPDCSQFLSKGFVDFGEFGPQCGDGKDNDGDGNTDCNDISCKYDPFFCSSTGFNFTSPDTSDKSAPKTVFVNVETFPDGAFIVTNTNEPSNLSLEYFWNDSNCITGTANQTVVDDTLNDSSTANDYTLFHDVALDSLNPDFFAIPRNTTQYYRLSMCDPVGNCAKSACLSFTTKASTSSSDCSNCNITLKPEFTPTTSNTSAPLGNLVVGFDLNHDSTYETNISKDASYGQVINYTQGRNLTVLLTNPNATASDQWKIELFGVDLISKSTTLNFTDTLIFNDTSGNDFVGMKSDKFKSLMQSIGVDKIEITIPANGSTLSYCDENNISNCQNVTATKLAATDTSSEWSIIVGSTGFSSYGIGGGGGSGGGTGGAGGSTGGGGGGGGGGGQVSRVISKKIATVQPNDPQTAILNINKESIKKITFITNKKVNKLLLEVYNRGKGTKPEAGVPTFQGDVFEFFEVKVENLTQSDLQSVEFELKVEADWLKNKTIGKSDLKLYRYNNNNWQELPTTYVGEDGKFSLFKAQSPGFSYFAVGKAKEGAATQVQQPSEEVPTGEQPTKPTTPTQAPTTQTPSAPTTQPTQEIYEEPTQIEEPQRKTSLYLWLILIIAILAAAYFFFYRQKNQKDNFWKKSPPRGGY